jgi:HK97 family phage major capsid protein
MAVAIRSRPERTTGLPAAMASSGFEVKTVERSHWSEDLVVTPDGRPFAPLQVYGGRYPDAPMPSEWLAYGARPDPSYLPSARDHGRDWRAWTAKMRYASRRDYQAAWLRWLQLVGKTRSAEVGYAMLGHPDVDILDRGYHQHEETKGLVESIDQLGGFLVPPDFQAEVLSRLPESGHLPVLDLCDVRPVASDALVLPRMQPNALYPSILPGGMTFTAAGETPIGPDFDPVFGSFNVPIRKFIGKTAISNDLLQDATYVATEIARIAAGALATLFEQEFLLGSNPLHWQGVTTLPTIPAVDITGPTAHSISNSTSNPGSATPIRALVSSLPPQYRNRGRAWWFFSQSVENALQGLVTSTGSQILQFGLTDQADFVLENHRYLMSNWLGPNGTPGVAMVLGDPKSYIIANRVDMTARLDTETFGDQDKTQLILVARAGGAPYIDDGFRLGVLS